MTTYIDSEVASGMAASTRLNTSIQLVDAAFFGTYEYIRSATAMVVILVSSLI